MTKSKAPSSRPAAARAFVAVRHALEQPRLGELAQAPGERGAGHVEVFAEVVEAAHAVERLAEQQERPALSDHVEGLGHRAVGEVDGSPVHASKDSHLRSSLRLSYGLSSMSELNVQAAAR